MSTPNIIVYWLNDSRADRALWLLHELSLPYTVVSYKRENLHAPKSARSIHPLGKFPMVSLDGRVIAESGLVTDILIEKFGTPLLAPENEEDRFRYRYFNYYAEGSLMPPLLVGFIMNAMKSAPVPFFVKPVLRMVAGKVEASFLNGEYKLQLDFLEGELAQREFIAGDKFTGADIMISWPLMTAKKERVPFLTQEKYPKIWAYLDRMSEREAFKKTQEKIKELEAEILATSKL